ADHTTATVEPVGSTPGSKSTTDVTDLNPKGQEKPDTPSTFDFTYALGAPCKPGFKVRASLSTAVTFNGNKETNLANNKTPDVEVCPQPSLTNIKPDVERVKPDLTILPEFARP